MKTRDPFASRKPMADNHPVMEYLNWQIALHEEHMEHLCGGWFDSTVEQMKKTLADPYTREYGIPERAFEGLKYGTDEMKRIGDQLGRLKRERLRLKKDVDFRGNGSYLL